MLMYLKKMKKMKKILYICYLLMVKPGNWFAVAEMWESDLKKKIKKYLHLYLKFHSWTVSSFCLCKSTTWFLHKWNIDYKCVITNNYRVREINGLLKWICQD